MYTDPCVAFAHLADGDTVTIDANGGTPYYETLAEGSGGSGGTCIITNNNLTISGINGRPIIDGSQAGVVKGMWIVNGHDIVINNIEFRGTTNSADDTSANAVRIQASNGHGPTAPGGQTPNGGNITIENSYFLSNDQGLLTTESGISPKTGMDNGEWYSSSPYITFQYDEFAYNGVDAASVNATGLPGHSFYIGHDWNEAETFTLQYSWTHDDLYGHTIRDRAPISNISYNMISDTVGNSGFMIDVPNGGSTYIVGNVVYKTQVADWQDNNNPANAVVFMAYRESSHSTGDPGVYTKQDLHVVNNTAIDDSQAGPGSDTSFMLEECFNKLDQTQCLAPIYGPPLTTKGVFENNIFIGYPTQMTNDLAAYTAGNVNLLNTEPTDANMAALHFANPDALDFHITSGSSAIGMGIYPPTDNTGATDMNAYAQYQYVPGMATWTAADSRPTPGGSTMDAGAFSYPPPSAPSLGLNISPSTVTIPNTGTITVTGLPTPPAGSFNYATPISGNTSVVTTQSAASSTSSVTMQYQTIPGIGSATVVPVNVYADGGIVSGNITVNPGPPVPYSITLDDTNFPYLAGTTVHLEGPAPTGGQVVNLSSSDSTIVSVPSTVTVPQGQISAETGSLIGSEWGPTPTNKTATITATVGSNSAQGTFKFWDLRLTRFQCVTSPCASIQGGNTYQVYATFIGSAPAGGSTVQITSSNSAVIPNQSYVVPAGTSGPASNKIEITTNTVTSNQTVTISASFNGALLTTGSITVTAGNPATSIVVNTGNNQTANVGTEFSQDLNALVTDASGNPVAGVPVTISPGPGVTIIYSGGSGTCTPPVTTTGGAGQMCFDAEPTASGPLTVSVSAAGVSAPAVFNLTGTGGATPASIAAYSGSGQSSNVGTAFTNPLVAIVKDSTGNPVSGATVTFSGTGLSFSPTSAVTNSSGLASTTATPTATGSLTADASVSGVGTPATFSETGTSPVAVSSITRDTVYGPGTTVHLTAAAPAGGAVVALSSSDSTVGYIPASVTVPAGQTSAEDGSFLGSLWGQSPAKKSVTFTATYNGTAQLTEYLYSPHLLSFDCPGGSCTVTGGNTINMTTSITASAAPYGGGTETFTSNNTAVIPNQSLAYNAGQNQSVDGPTMPLATNSVATTTSVTVTAAFNGSQITRTFTVNP